MRISDLLVAMLQAAMKARDVARIIRSEPALLELLVEEKKGAEKNKRFAQDFKTLADVLIQQMLSHDIVMQFPEMEGSIFGEESNQLTNTLGETTTIHMCVSMEQTKQQLKDILDDNEEAATLLSEVVHRQASVPTGIENLEAMSASVPSDDVGIWIDPIDSTAQYIRGEVGHLNGDGITDGGLQCVAVLIGAFQKSSGLPIVGVSIQPFWQLDPVSHQWSDNVTWGVCYEDLHFASVSENNQSTKDGLSAIVMSTSESEAVKQMLARNFKLLFASGAGYKLLCTTQRRVDAYVLSKSSIYLWDCCAPHAILRATGGGMVRFHNTVSWLKLQGADADLDEGMKELEVRYHLSDVSENGEKSIDGVIAYSDRVILEKILQSLAE